MPFSPLKSGTQSLEETEIRRVSQVITWLSLAGVAFLLGIGIRSWLSGDPFHGQVLFAFAAALLANQLVFAWVGSFSLQKAGLISLVIVLFIYLISTGGQNNTGPLWFYVFPPLVFFLTNLKIGTILVLICMLFSISVFHWPEAPWVTTEYGADFQMRFLATIVFATVFCFVLDYSRRHARRELLNVAALYERAAKTDELTGLPNRRAMLNHLSREFSRYQRHGHHFALMLLDLDHFKRINDDFGHEAGDAVLTQFAALLRQTCREEDTPSRWGGEEFLLLLPNTSQSQAVNLGERLRRTVEEHLFAHKDSRIPVTVSAGIASVADATDVEGLLRLADGLLYEAKGAGRNRMVTAKESVATQGSLRDSPAPR